MLIILEQVVDILRKRIVEQAYKPGERLLIDKLANELDVSHTPIREALGRLQGEGLVSYRRHQGYHVTPLSDRELHEMLECRMMIETFAVEQIDPITDELVDQLEAIHTRFCVMMAQKQCFEQNAADREFHETIVAATGNALLLRLFRSMNSHMRTMRLFDFGEGMSENQGETRAEHEEILAAFQCRDKLRAAQALAEHFHGVRSRVQRLAPLQPSQRADAESHGEGDMRRRRLRTGRSETAAREPADPPGQGGS